MASFGKGVSALIETYTKCLRLLKALGDHHSGAESSGLTFSEVQSLRGSIRSDRSQVRRAYSSRLSKRGTRLEKGDSCAKSTLQRILKRLKNAIQSLLSPSKVKTPALDYGSLVSLSSSSRADTIRTIDDLSKRLSSASLVRQKHGSKPYTSHHDSRHSRRVDSRGELHNEGAKTTGSQRLSSSPHRPQREGGRSAKYPKETTSEHHGRDHSTTSLVTTISRQTPSRRGPSRNSYTSGSSGSTKLGEIPSRHRHRTRRGSETSCPASPYDGPVYPLQPYKSLAKKKQKQGLWRRILGHDQF